MPAKIYGPEDAQKILDRTDRMGVHHSFTEHIARPLMKAVWRRSGKHPNMWIHQDHLDKIPEEPFVAGLNHSHNDDSVAVKILFKGREVMVPAALYLFENTYQARLYKAMGAIPLIRPGVDGDNGQNNWPERKKDLANHLSDGGIAFVYHEGTRDPALRKASPGAADLAISADVPLLPIALAGTHIEGSSIAVSVGEPITYSEAYDSKRDPHRAATVGMTRELQQQMPGLFVEAYELLAQKTGVDVSAIMPPIEYEWS